MTKRDTFKEKINTSFGYVCSEIFNDADPKRVSTQITDAGHINYILAFNYEDKAVASLNSILSPFATESGVDPDNNFFPFIQSGDIPVSPDCRNKYVVDEDTTDEFWYVSGQNYRSQMYATNALKLTYGTVLTVGDAQMNQEETNAGTQAGRVRAIGFANPTVFTGWGYTTNGRPVPSVYDYMMTYSGGIHEIRQLEQSGTFADFEWPTDVSPTESGDYHFGYVRDMIKARKRLDDKLNTFYKDYDSRQDLHRAGPLDVRWNDTRKVWCSGPERKEGYLISALDSAPGRLASPNYTSGEMIVCDGIGSNWRKIEPEKKIWVVNRSLLSGPSGAYIIVEEMPNGEYRPIWSDCDADPSGAPPSYVNAVQFGDV